MYSSGQASGEPATTACSAATSSHSHRGKLNNPARIHPFSQNLTFPSRQLKDLQKAEERRSSKSKSDEGAQGSHQ